MSNLNFKQWLTEQQLSKQVVTPQDKVLNAEIEKAIINAKAKGGDSATTMAPAVLANIITPDLLRNQQVQKAIKEKLRQDTASKIDMKNKESQKTAQTTATATAKPLAVKTTV